VRHAPSFFDHDYGRGTKAHQVVRRGVEQDAYRETGRDPHPIKGAFDMREATKCGADIRRHTPLSTAVNLTDLELDSRLIRISPPRADSNRSPPGRNRFKKTRSKGGDPLENWTWGLSLTALTIAMHAAGIILMALAGVSIRARIESRNHLTLRHAAAIQIGLIGALGLLLAAQHGIEAALWAAAYWWLGALNSPTDAILYSVDSMSTRGGSGLTLERHWQLIGALEAMDGMLLFGISTVFIFVDDARLLATPGPPPLSLS